MLNYKEIGYMATQYEGSMNYRECVEQAIIDELIRTDLEDTDDSTVVDIYNMYLLDDGRSDDVWYSYGELTDIISSMSAEEAFRLGVNSSNEFCWVDDFFRFDGYGNIESSSDYAIAKEALKDMDFIQWCYKRQEFDESDIDECVDYLKKYLEAGC